MRTNHHNQTNHDPRALRDATKNKHIPISKRRLARDSLTSVLDLRLDADVPDPAEVVKGCEDDAAVRHHNTDRIRLLIIRQTEILKIPTNDLPMIKQKHTHHHHQQPQYNDRIEAGQRQLLVRNMQIHMPATLVDHDRPNPTTTQYDTRHDHQHDHNLRQLQKPTQIQTVHNKLTDPMLPTELTNHQRRRHNQNVHSETQIHPAPQPNLIELKKTPKQRHPTELTAFADQHPNVEIGLQRIRSDQLVEQILLPDRNNNDPATKRLKLKTEVSAHRSNVSGTKKPSNKKTTNWNRVASLKIKLA